MDIFKSYDAKFVFIGHRSYVHGSSLTYGLFEAVESWSLGPVEKVQVKVNSLLKEQGRYDLFPSDKGENAEKAHNAMFRIECGSIVYFVGLQGRGEPIMVSEPYDEQNLIAGCEIEKDLNAAMLMLKSDAHLINIIIALNKRLVCTLLPSKGYGQWFLARYDLAWGKMQLIGKALLEIKVVGHIGASNTKSTVILGGEPVGSIHFSRSITK